MISIIIPSFNQAQYLPDCIESAWNQTASKQTIVVDDGSNDGSLEIARKYEKDGKITVISQINKGLASARNAGIMSAGVDLNGNFQSHNIWCLFLDADDMLLENAVERIQETIKANPDADIIAPSLKTFGTSNETITLMANPKLEDFRVGNRIGYCCAIRKSRLLEVGGYNPKMIWGYEDLALTCLLLSKGAKLVTIPEPLWLYRTKEQSMITEAKKHHQELLDIINKDVPEAQLNF